MLSGVEAVDVVLIMHVEGDLVNKRGERSKIAVEEQSFNHVSLAIDVLRGEARLSDCRPLMEDVVAVRRAREVLGPRLARALGL